MKKCIHYRTDDGWWLRSSRLIFQRTLLGSKQYRNVFAGSKPIVIIGKNGTLGRAFSRICNDRSIPNLLLGREDCDITNSERVEQIISTYQPWAIINAAGYVRVDDAENEADRCFNENSIAAENLATVCLKYDVKLLSFSSDLVFDGTKRKPYVESDTVNPLNIYGKSKAKSEELILEANPSSLIIRAAAFFGPWDQYNFLHYVIDNLSNQQLITVANDVSVSPTYVPDLVNASIDLLIDDEQGIWHLANKGAITWADLAYDTASRWRLDPMFINSMPLNELNMTAKRPLYSVLGSEKGIFLPSLESALERFFSERKITVSTKSII